MTLYIYFTNGSEKKLKDVYCIVVGSGNMCLTVDGEDIRYPLSSIYSYQVLA
jgi:hypothetical protein